MISFPLQHNGEMPLHRVCFGHKPMQNKKAMNCFGKVQLGCHKFYSDQVFGEMGGRGGEVKVSSTDDKGQRNRTKKMDGWKDGWM